MTPYELARLGEPPSSIKYLAEHPEHVPATPPQPINPPSADEE